MGLSCFRNKIKSEKTKSESDGEFNVIEQLTFCRDQFWGTNIDEVDVRTPNVLIRLCSLYQAIWLISDDLTAWDSIDDSSVVWTEDIHIYKFPAFVIDNNKIIEVAVGITKLTMHTRSTEEYPGDECNAWLFYLTDSVLLLTRNDVRSFRGRY